MASSTTNLGLRKPDPAENWSVQNDFNANMEKIDEFAGKVPSQYGEAIDSFDKLKSAVTENTNKATFVRVTNSLMRSIFGIGRQAMFMCFDYGTGYIEIVAWDTYADVYSCSFKRADNSVTDIKKYSQKTTGSGTASNQYGSANYSYNIRANICTVTVTYTPNTNISTSSGILTLSDIPVPSSNCISATYAEAQLGSSFGAAVLDNRACRFLGARTSGVEYSASFSYVIA